MIYLYSIGAIYFSIAALFWCVFIALSAESIRRHEFDANTIQQVAGLALLFGAVSLAWPLLIKELINEAW